MNFATLAILYFLVGLACGLAVLRRSGRAGTLHAALAVVLWPLWAPIALFDAGEQRAAPIEAAARIELALREGAGAAAGTALEAMLNGPAAERIAAMVRRAAARRGELEALLRRPEFCLERARRRAAETRGDGSRAPATARLHLQNVERLHAMACHDAAALDELADLTEALRAQLLMARFAGSSAGGIGDIVGDVFTRVEALAEAWSADPLEGPGAAASEDTRGETGFDHGLASHSGGR